ncbi:cupin domain-containing protein [Geodermatophilus sp. SYSU D01062]
MTRPETRTLPAGPDYLAPDGSEVRLLVTGAHGSAAHSTLPAGAVSRAVVHRTVEELWYVVSGSGQMWRRSAAEPDGVVDLRAGVSVSIPVGTAFQFRSAEGEPLVAVATTVPPWPGADEAQPCEGIWTPTA